jgi:hypothetical protein
VKGVTHCVGKTYFHGQHERVGSNFDAHSWYLTLDTENLDSSKLDQDFSGARFR